MRKPDCWRKLNTSFDCWPNPIRILNPRASYFSRCEPCDAQGETSCSTVATSHHRQRRTRPNEMDGDTDCCEVVSKLLRVMHRQWRAVASNYVSAFAIADGTQPSIRSCWQIQLSIG